MAVGKLADAAFECRMVRCQGRFDDLGVAGEHARHFAEAQSERSQLHDLAGTCHLGGAIGAPAGRGADRRDQAALLVQPESLGGDAKPPGRFGRIEELGAGAHESPRCRLTAVLIGVAAGAGSSEQAGYPPQAARACRNVSPR